MRFPSSWSAVVVLAALAGLARAESASFTGVVDLAGRRFEALPPGPGPTVLVFTRTDCPISNREAPALRRLGERFARRGVVFRLVYADPTETPAAIREHMQAFGLGGGALRDPQHELVRLAGATGTPGVAGVVAPPSGPPRVYPRRLRHPAPHFRPPPPPPPPPAPPPLTPRPTTAVGCVIPELQ